MSQYRHSMSKRKRPRGNAALWNFSDTRGVRLAYCFGASLLGFGVGVLGFGVVAPGAFTAGFVPVPEDAGAATPD